MNNLQDELAWLNHRLDNKLEEWRKLHRLHGRFNVFLMYCLLVLIAVSAYYYFIRKQATGLEIYIIAASFAADGALLAFSLLKWRLYHRLLTKGHDDKVQIDRKHITSTPSKDDLGKCQDDLINLLRIERSFPFSDYLKRLVRDAIGAFFGLPKGIAQIVKTIMRKIQSAVVELFGWAKNICAKIIYPVRCGVRSAIKAFSVTIKTCAKKLRHILFRLAQIRKRVILLKKNIKKLEKDVKELDGDVKKSKELIKQFKEHVSKLEEGIKRLEEDVEKLKEHVGETPLEKPKGQ